MFLRTLSRRRPSFRRPRATDRVRRRIALERLESRAVLSVAPVGGQFLIGAQLAPPEAAASVALLDDTGRFVAAWQSYGVDGDGYGIVAQVFEADGQPLAGAPAVVVNLPVAGDVALGNQIGAAVASDGAGHFVIAWQGETRTAAGYDVYYRLGSFDGAALSLEAQSVASGTTAGDQTAVAVAMAAGGDFTIAWQTPGATAGDGIDVVFRRGTLITGLEGGEVSASTGTAGDQVAPTATMNAAGQLVLAWRGPATDGGTEEAGAIFARGFATDGVAVTGDVRVNEAAYNDLGVPDVALNAAGMLAVAWQVEGQAESGSDVFGRRLLLDGAAGTLTPQPTAGLGTGDIRLNEVTQGPQRAPTVGIDADGDMFAAWQTQHQDGYSWAIFGRRYAAAADTLGSEFLVNLGTQLGPQIAPDMAVDAAGRTVVAWIGPDVPETAEEGEGGHAPAVHARIFSDAGATAVGGEVVLSRYTGLEDSAAVAASDAAGNMVIVWQSWEAPGDDSDFGIYAKRVRADGRFVDLNGNGVDDDVFQVNTFTAGGQSRPVVASDPSGNFVVVWQSDRQDGSGGGIYCRRYDASLGAWADAAEFRVNVTTAGDQSHPAVACNGPGGFTVVWQGSDADGTGIYRRRYAASGAAGEGEVLVNVVTDTDQTAPVIGMNDSGESVIAWVSDHNTALDPLDGEKSVFARWFGPTGVPLGPREFLVHTYVPDAQENPSVDLAASGNFVVAWQSINQERNMEAVGSSWGVYARRFVVDKVAGTVTSPDAGEFRVNQTADGPQRFAAVGVDDTGRFTVAWQSIRQDGSSWAVLARHYAADGTAAGAEAVVNTFTNGPQILPTIAQRGAGDFTVVWSGQGTGRVDGAWGRRYRFIRDDFNRGSVPSLGPDWITAAGDFDVASDMAVIKSSQAIARVRGVQVANVSLQAVMTLSGPASVNAGLVARAGGSGMTSYYWGGIRRQGEGFRAEIARQVNGTWTTLASAALPVGSGLVRFDVLGDSLKLFIDERFVVAANDRTLTAAGWIGVQGGFEGYFDDFTHATLRHASARLPFEDAFSQPNGSQLSRFWVERSGNFTAQANRAQGRPGVNLATVNAAAVVDVVLTSSVNVATNGSHAGVVTRVSEDGRSMYWGGLVNRNGVLSAEVWLIVDGTVRRLRTASLPQSTAIDHAIHFESMGSIHRVSINGTLAVELLDTTLAAAGSVGMRSSAGTSFAWFRAG